MSLADHLSGQPNNAQKILPWAAPRIHGELLKLGFDVSVRTISRYIHRISPSDQSQRFWTVFLHK